MSPHPAASEAAAFRGIQLVIVKQGPHGVLARTRDERVEVAALPVDVVNALGVGDAFDGAIWHGLLAGWPLQPVLRFSVLPGRLWPPGLECSTAMPTEYEIDMLMSEHRKNMDEATGSPSGHVAAELVHGGAS